MILSKLGNHQNKNLAVIYPQGFELPKCIKKSTFDVRELSY
jgi:hypothetical protein